MDRLSDTNENVALSAEVLERALHATDIMVVLTDPRQDDNPIVWVNDYFCEFTGYSRDEVLGRNCRFLQGDDRDQAGIGRVRRAVEAGDSVHALLHNYKKDGGHFYNDLFVSPVYEDRDDPESELLYFVGVQNNSSARVAAENEVAEREREIEETAENERERFGMDLHDGLGQELSGLGLLAQAHLSRLEGEGSDHAPAAARILELLQGAMESARDMARGLNPVDSSPHGLGDAIRTLCRAVEEVHPDLEVRARVEDVAFEDRREARHLYRIAQEAVSNAAKHSGATEVVVTLRSAPVRGGGTAVHLEVRDDGRGIPDAVVRVARSAAESAERRAALTRQGMGLYGMRYRAELVGASLTIGSAEGGGTVVRCTLPREQEARAGHHARRGERD